LQIEGPYPINFTLYSADIRLFYFKKLKLSPSPLSVQAALLLSLLVLASLEDMEMLVMMAIK
jgi:hypothetical protein